ncbi:MAG: adenylate/guanylate cyclase domain-containing protein [Spirochaetales bacterium]|nr:adenylate/guanylate cyclase domain-containing protein [Spirochaetales bacterium]MBR6200938.1 adenylate/guanylate cyclase domain-containing protein [Spirochaetales bacterium]
MLIDKGLHVIFIMLFISAALHAEVFHAPSHEELKSKRIMLNVPWEFYQGRFISPEDIDDQTADDTVTPPCVWNAYFPNGLGCGTFRLQIDGLNPSIQYTLFLYDAIGTSFNLYANGELLITVGKPNEDWTQAEGDQSMKLVDMFCDSDGCIDLILHVSNNFHRKGGIWGNIRFGERNVMQRNFIRDVNRRFIFLGMLFFIMFFHFIFYLTQPDDKVSLFLSLFSLGIAMRIIVQGFSILKFYFPQVPYILCLKMEYTALFLCPACYAMYVRYLYGADKFPYKSDIYTFIINSVFGVLVWLGEISFISRLVPILQVDFVISSIAMISAQFRLSFQKGRVDTGLMMALTTLMIFLFGAHDMATFNYIPVPFPTVMLLPYSALIFVAAQSYITAKNREDSMKRIRKMSDNLTQTNEIYYRFVPKEFLTLLGKDNITDVQLDDRSTKSLAIMSADVRDFTVMSEKLSEDEVFDVLNKYLSTIGPIIRDHGGFIEKYLGDGIIVLFPNDGVRAAECAIAIQKAVSELNNEFHLRDNDTFRIGIGIHYGEVVLMTVGEEDRMTGLTISGAVNTVLRLEALTKKYKQPIIVSQTFADQYGLSDKYKLSALDTIRLDDENKNEVIYTVNMV